MSDTEPYIRITRGTATPAEVAALTAVLLTLAACRAASPADAETEPPTPGAPWSLTPAQDRSAGAWSAGTFPAWRTSG
ncbi:acyl-CoA carboxylase subunit epsilon [Streptomyces montanus]|uniref:Acyl-CoA carboxylase subunit epsilon n=1 Tax=Streptomyces montanus TaxID=2580423 RepID=A0A5R9G1G7_9ACTN|nr:acyl-CoA carboxylase subunit epsilon [Streptomyces montanus]TLS47338.1 acyl-CoA carboxylase subunit epsilon [Streptomyces montanus]